MFKNEKINFLYREEGQIVPGTLLHTAIDSGNLEAVRLLVAAGANCNKRNEAGFTSLHRSAYKGGVISEDFSIYVWIKSFGHDVES